MKRKMVLIGAGSAMFTQGLVVDLMRNTGGFQWQLGLVDTDPKALELIRRLCEKMIQAKESDIEMSYSTDRCDLLTGADYVVSTIGVGGRRAWEQDVFIPRKYGVYQPVGDTAMPGGISRAMRMVPAILDIVRDIEGLCPNAHFFNYSNPMAILCRAVSKVSKFPMTGLCHGINHMEGYLADFMEADRREASFLSVGINHLTFMYDIRVKGKDAKPRILEKLALLKQQGSLSHSAEETFYEMGAASPIQEEPYSWEIFEKLGAFPAPGDRHITEFFTEGFPGGHYYGKTLGVDAFSFEDTIAWGDQIFDRMEQLGRGYDPLPEDFFDRMPGEHEQLMEIIDSMERDRRKIFSVNLPNGGAVSNLPSQGVLEMPAVAAADGFHPLIIHNFPDVLAAIIQRHLAVVEVTAEAALAGDRRLFEEAILMGGYISDRSAVNKMVQELIEVHKGYLPQFV